MYKFPEIFAHRGASAYAPENTLIAVEIAKEKGATAIECDVMLTADGYPIVFHDAWADRTTNSKGAISNMTLTTVRRLDAGSWFRGDFFGEPIPLLEELLIKCLSLGLSINLEIKPTPGTEQRTVEKIIACVAQHWSAHAVPLLYSSFCQKTLMLLREQGSHVLIGMLYETWDEIDFDKAKVLKPVSIHLEKTAFTKKRVAHLRGEGYVACAYTVNDAVEARDLQAMGVTSLFSDYPDLLRCP